MINKLDNLSYIFKVDKSGSYKSIELLCAQIKQVVKDSRLIKIPKDYSKVNKIVISGMGGSNLGGHIIKSVFSDSFKIPVIITAGYEVPLFVDNQTLYIISSYSGNTEEPLTTYQEAKKRKAKILAITANSKGNLAKIMLKNNISGYIYKDENNPGGIPRYGIGYAVFGIMVLLAKSGIFSIKINDIQKIISNLELRDCKFRPEEKKILNPAKKIALNLYNKKIVIVVAEFLEGNAHTLRNQFMETSKNFASFLVLPDLNHFAMEGLNFPRNNKKNLVFLFFDSKLYHPRIQKRIMLTKQIIKKNDIKEVSYELLGTSKLEQAFEMLQLGSWISFYLAILNGINPAPNLWVDWFKKELH